MSLYTRRDFAKLALAALPAAGLLSAMNTARGAEMAKPAAGKPNSKVNGVQIGLNVPYSFGNPGMSGDDVIKNCVLLGVSASNCARSPSRRFSVRPSRPWSLPAAPPSIPSRPRPTPTSSKPGAALFPWTK